MSLEPGSGAQVAVRSSVRRSLRGLPNFSLCCTVRISVQGILSAEKKNPRALARPDGTAGQSSHGFPPTQKGLRSAIKRDPRPVRRIDGLCMGAPFFAYFAKGGSQHPYLALGPAARIASEASNC